SISSGASSPNSPDLFAASPWPPLSQLVENFPFFGSEQLISEAMLGLATLYPDSLGSEPVNSPQVAAKTVDMDKDANQPLE
ncbi:hypothetical protein KI387_018272, partial [Taxus chinensis]